jgi:V/A-type H+-transporting ATPase subunit I
MAIMGKPYPHWMIGIPIGAAVLILLEKRLAFWLFHHGEKVSIALGFVEIFESTLSMLSNTISFLRVGAFALNHGAFGKRGVHPRADVERPVGKAIILVIGNLFVIVLEGMIVGIQALRLEYYEFFVKFFPRGRERIQGFDIYKKQRVR